MGLTPQDHEEPGVAGYGSQAIVDPPYGWDTSWWDLDHMGDPLPGVLTS